ncbi:hypothetical protein CRE_15965 [Caenorhabditis remanei]|uniref:Uncharacterized protein n=1 Tax=Caenorhabditis remanei TaxID=31234 RepID=E3MBT6_CAERE|nr:hypothetical protein CRE_15965 [Caenorhabditis remanei]
MSNNQVEEIKRPMSKKNVIVLMAVTFIGVAVKELRWLVCVAKAFYEGECQMKSALYLIYFVVYMSQQVVLFVGMTLNFFTKKSASSHSEYVIATHTRCIGTVKLIMIVIASVCFLNGYVSEMIVPGFLAIDLFLAPIVIEITEIMTNSKIVKPIRVQMVPCNM